MTGRMVIDLQVRDYEVDMQGVVNNAVYQNYLEHCRHEYLKQHGLDFADLTRQGVFLVLVHADLRYRQPLRSGDRFQVHLQAERESALRFRFRQQIVRLDGGVVLEASMLASCMTGEGKPFLPRSLRPLLQQMFPDPS